MNSLFELVLRLPDLGNEPFNLDTVFHINSQLEQVPKPGLVGIDLGQLQHGFNLCPAGDLLNEAGLPHVLGQFQSMCPGQLLKSFFFLRGDPDRNHFGFLIFGVHGSSFHAFPEGKAAGFKKASQSRTLSRRRIRNAFVYTNAHPALPTPKKEYLYNSPFVNDLYFLG